MVSSPGAPPKGLTEKQMVTLEPFTGETLLRLEVLYW